MSDDPQPRLSIAAQEVMTFYIERLGLSYADAIARAERTAEEAAAPYLEVAARLRHELTKAEDGRVAS
jgi:hypothetical protein